MKKRKKWNVVLGKRDRRVLRDLFYSKGLDLDLLMDNHFEGLHKSTVVKRMQRLLNGNLIEKRSYNNDNTIKIIYCITEYGLSQIDDELSGIVLRKELKSSSPQHDLDISRIYFRLNCARNIESIKLENEIQGIGHGDLEDRIAPFKRLNSDIFLSLLINNQVFQIAIEYERSQKESSRWTEYLLNYHLEENIDAVLYICANSTIQKGLIKIESELAKKYSHKVYFCMRNEFFKISNSAIFKNTSGKTFTLNFQEKNYHHPTNSLVANAL